MELTFYIICMYTLHEILKKYFLFLIKKQHLRFFFIAIFENATESRLLSSMFVCTKHFMQKGVCWSCVHFC